jgi:predicted porin
VPKRLLSLAALCLAGGAVAAEPPPPLGVPDLVGPRTLALQSGIALASGNEALFLNPAALAARRRYVADTFFLTDRRPGLSGSSRQQDWFGGAVEDASTTKVAAGLAYARGLKGTETGTLLRLGLASAVSEGVYLGLQGNYYDLHGRSDAGVRIKSAFNLDAGLFYQVTPTVAIGGTAYNLLGAKREERGVLPRGYGAGVVAGKDTSLQVAADWRYDLDRISPKGKKKTNRFSIGAEYLFSGAVPLRAGFEIDETSKTNWWSAGAGYVTTRFGIDLGYRQSTTDPKAKTIGVGLKVYVPSE